MKYRVVLLSDNTYVVQSKYLLCFWMRISNPSREEVALEVMRDQIEADEQGKARVCRVVATGESK